MQRYKGTFDVFFGTEHRRRKEVMEEQFNKEAKQGWRILAADSARISDENAGSEDRKHTSGGVIVAVDSNLGAVSGKIEVVQQMKTTRHPRLIACDANVCAEDFKKSLWFKKQTHVHSGASGRRFSLQIQRARMAS